MFRDRPDKHRRVTQTTPSSSDESAALELHEDTGHQHSPGLLRRLRYQPGPLRLAHSTRRSQPVTLRRLAPPESHKPMYK